MEVEIYHGHHVPHAQGICVVIDVLRAFTTAAFAFGNGAEEITFVASPQDAFFLKEKDPSLILMGENNGNPIEGFHFGNSPKEIERASLANSKMVQRTSSGTQGIVGCSHASHIFASSFVTAEATLKSIIELNPSHVSLIVTGRHNGDEDLALAEYLKARLQNQTCDLDQLLKRVKLSLAASRMIRGKYAYPDGKEDVAHAMKIDHFPFAIKVFKEEGRLVGKAIFQN